MHKVFRNLAVSDAALQAVTHAIKIGKVKSYKTPHDGRLAERLDGTHGVGTGPCEFILDGQQLKWRWSQTNINTITGNATMMEICAASEQWQS